MPQAEGFCGLGALRFRDGSGWSGILSGHPIPDEIQVFEFGLEPEPAEAADKDQSGEDTYSNPVQSAPQVNPLCQLMDNGDCSAHVEEIEVAFQDNLSDGPDVKRMEPALGFQQLDFAGEERSWP